MKLVIMRKLPSSFRAVVFVLRMKVFAKTVLKHYSQIMFMKTVRILRTSFTDQAPVFRVHLSSPRVLLALVTALMWASRMAFEVNVAFEST